MWTSSRIRPERKSWQRSFLLSDGTLNGALGQVEVVLVDVDGVLGGDGAGLEAEAEEGAGVEILLENKGRVVSRDDIMVKLWETDSFVDENTLTVNVARLRKKLEAYGLKDFIRTKKGMGYLVE